MHPSRGAPSSHAAPGCPAELQPKSQSNFLKATITILIATSIVAFAGPAAEIDDPRGSLTLRQALALALTRSPELAAVDHDVRIAEARILQAKLRPNPDAEFTSENVAGS